MVRWMLPIFLAGVFSQRLVGDVLIDVALSVNAVVGSRVIGLASVSSFGRGALFRESC
jgi:hypothetical protein